MNGREVFHKILGLIVFLIISIIVVLFLLMAGGFLLWILLGGECGLLSICDNTGCFDVQRSLLIEENNSENCFDEENIYLTALIKEDYYEVANFDDEAIRFYFTIEEPKSEEALIEIELKRNITEKKFEIEWDGLAERRIINVYIGSIAKIDGELVKCASLPEIEIERCE